MELDAVMRTTGAVRALTDAPVDDAALYRVLERARFAPSGGNRQPWRVVVVADPDQRRAVRDLCVLGWREYVAFVATGQVPFAPGPDGTPNRSALDLDAARATPSPAPFVDDLDTAPAVLVVGAHLPSLAVLDWGLERQSIVGGGSVYPFVQNLLLAARDEGLGGVMTTFLARQEEAARTRLHMPRDVAIAAVVALGIPDRFPSRLTRRPVEEFTTIDRFDGAPFRARADPAAATLRDRPERAARARARDSAPPRRAATARRGCEDSLMAKRPPSAADGHPVPGQAVVPWTRPEPPAIGVTGLLRRATDLGLGAASIAASAAVDAIERFVPGEPVEGEPMPAPGVLRLVPGALIGAGLVAQRRMLDVSARVERGAAQVAGMLARTPVVGAPVRATEGYLERWSDAGEAEQARNRALVAEFVRRLAPELATAVVTQLDMDALMGQLPIDAIVARVDIDALLDRVDVDGIIDRVDVEKIIDRVDVDKIVGRVDVEKIIDRVDVDKIVARVDVQAIMGRVDIAPMADEIISEVDIAAIVRQSTGSITGDAVDGGRVTAMRLDGFIDRVTDKILLRRKARSLTVSGYAPGETGEREE